MADIQVILLEEGSYRLKVHSVLKSQNHIGNIYKSAVLEVLDDDDAVLATRHWVTTSALPDQEAEWDFLSTRVGKIVYGYAWVKELKTKFRGPVHVLLCKFSDLYLWPLKETDDPDPDQRFLDSLDDTIMADRVFMLNTAATGETEIVCSGLLTRRAAVLRRREADPSRRAIIVAEEDLIRYRKLDHGAPISESILGSHSLLGPVGMFWEMLARAWEQRLITEIRS